MAYLRAARVFPARGRLSSPDAASDLGPWAMADGQVGEDQGRARGTLDEQVDPGGEDGRVGKARIGEVELDQQEALGHARGARLPRSVRAVPEVEPAVERTRRRQPRPSGERNEAPAVQPRGARVGQI